MFVKADVWKELGGLDGDFFAHMEEIDFCWRCKNRGYKVMYCPDATVYHVGGGTLPKSSPFKTQLNFRNNLSMLYKNLPDRRRCRVIALRIVLDWVAALSFLLKGNLGEFKAVFKAQGDQVLSSPGTQESKSPVLSKLRPRSPAFSPRLTQDTADWTFYLSPVLLT